MRDNDTLDYFPLSGGIIPPSSPKTRRILDDPRKVPEPKNRIFQIDEYYNEYIKSKLACRDENLDLYYQTLNTVDKTPIIKFLINRLLREYLNMFEIEIQDKKIYLTNTQTFEVLVFDKDYALINAYFLNGEKRDYLDSFDALAMQVPEDLVIHTVQPKWVKDGMTEDDNKDDLVDFADTIHLCHANGWSADQDIGASFAEIHDFLPEKNKFFPNPTKMIQGFINGMATFERIGAISFRTNTDLNVHPNKPRNDKFHPVKNPNLILRFERQTVTGFKDIDAMLFTIRTYFVDVNNKDSVKKANFINALEADTSHVYSAEFLEEHKADILKWLKDK